MAQQKNTQPSDLDKNAPEGLNLTASEQKEARKEGAKADVQEAAQAAHHYLTDGNLPGEPSTNPFAGSDESQRYAYLLDYGIDQFGDLINGKQDFKPTDVQIHGLLALERNGKNRTEYVRPMMKHLKLKADELPGGGPAYTNDQTSITDL